MQTVERVDSPDPFADESRSVLAGCRRALSDLVEAMPGDIRSAAEFQRALKIDAKLAWQVFRFIHCESITGAAYLPGRQSLQKLAIAAKRRRLSQQIVESLTESIDRLDRLIARHAGDRATFDSMITMSGADEEDGLTLRQKRAAYRANRHLRGAEAAVQIKSMILRTSAQPNLLDVVGIQGYSDLRRIRYGGSLVVSRVRLSDDVHSVRSANWQPLGPKPGGAPGDSPLAPFCSPELPPFRAARTTSNFVVGELLGEAIGNHSAVTYIDGYIARAAVPRYRDSANRYGAMLTSVPIPCETMVLDLVVHERAFDRLSPIVGCYTTSLRESDLPDKMDTCERIPLNETIVHAGRGLRALESPDLPRHAEMYDAVFRHLGWESREFEVFRCRIAYPVMLSSVLIRFDLPEPPAQ
jgi:hypothetical protein